MVYFLEAQYDYQNQFDYIEEPKEFTFTLIGAVLQRRSRKLQYITMRTISIVAEESNI